MTMEQLRQLLSAAALLIVVVGRPARSETVAFASFHENSTICQTANGFACKEFASQAQAVALADLDHNGRLDAVISQVSAGIFGDRYVVCLDAGAGICTQVGNAGSERQALDVKLADLDNDGHLDAFFGVLDTTLRPSGAPNGICIGTGTGAFACRQIDSESKNTRGVALGDINGDGLVDALLANLETNSLCFNDGSATFSCEEIPGESDGFGIAAGLINGDNFLDMAHSGFGRPTRVCLGDGAGGFSCDNAAPSGLAVWLGHLDGDRELDLVVASGRGSACQGNGSGSFICQDMLPAPASIVAVDVGFLNADMFIDVVFAASNPVDPFEANRVCYGDTLGGFNCSDVPSAPRSFDVAVGHTVVYVDGFESGDSSGWSVTVP